MNINAIIIGIIQGIAEWLPVSSEGVIVLLDNNIFHNFNSLEEVVEFALFLHLGTTLAAIVYFRKEVKQLLTTLIKYKESKADDRMLLNFLIVTTLISGIVGFGLLQIAERFEDTFNDSARFINGLIGILLLVTAYLQVRSKQTNGTKKTPTLKDAVILGFFQSFAALPGLSRSGLTVSGLLLRKFNKIESLKISFLMSIPVVILGNILLNISDFQLSSSLALAFLASFSFGLLTIHWLLKLANRVNFAPFLVVVGALMIIAALI